MSLRQTTRDGKYVLRHELAGGPPLGCSANRLADGQPVWLLRLAPALSKEPRASQQWLEQARRLSAIQHDNVVQILEIGELDDEPYVVTEAPDAVFLSELVERHCLSCTAACSIAQQVLAGLDAVRRRGIWHPPLSTHDVVVTLSETSEPFAKVLAAALPADEAPADGPAQQDHVDVGSVSQMLLQMLGARPAEAGAKQLSAEPSLSGSPSAEPGASQQPSGPPASAERPLQQRQASVCFPSLPLCHPSDRSYFASISDSLLIAPRIPPAANTPNWELSPSHDSIQQDYTRSTSASRLVPLLALAVGSAVGVVASWLWGVF